MAQCTASFPWQFHCLLRNCTHLPVICFFYQALSRKRSFPLQSLWEKRHKRKVACYCLHLEGSQIKTMVSLLYHGGVLKLDTFYLYTTSLSTMKFRFKPDPHGFELQFRNKSNRRCEVRCFSVQFEEWVKVHFV